MRRTTLTAVALAALVLLAGCTGGGPGAGPSGASPTGTDASTPHTDASSPNGEAAHRASLDFYVSDRPAAIDDFAHLNVTIDEVVLVRAAGEDAEREEEETTTTPATTPTPNETATRTAVTNETPTATGSATATASPTETGTATPDPTTTSTGTSTPAVTPSPTDGGEDDVDEAENESDDEQAEAGRVTIDVPSETVDLTELQGADAMHLGRYDVPTGTYVKVFLEVSEVNATLTSGEQVNVKLPSERLHLKERFSLGANESVDFVFDIAVHKAGKSGKYVLRPVISESGTDVPIREVGSLDEDREDDRGEEGRERGDDRARGDEERDQRDDEVALTVRVVGDVAAGENVTIAVSRNGSAVANATVTLDDEVVGTTDVDGELTVAIPDDADSLDVKARLGDAEGELEVEFEDEDRKTDRDGGDANATDGDDDGDRPADGETRGDDRGNRDSGDDRGNGGQPDDE